jgi:hypothetical protein
MRNIVGLLKLFQRNILNHATQSKMYQNYKSIGEKGRTYSLVETFIGQAARWWETHSHRLQTWMTVSTYFVERFKDKKLSKAPDIPTFKIGYDLVEHIQHCESEWRKIGYKDERVCPHMFPSTLDEIPRKWYNI